jgi:hypothetical protein
MKSSIKSFDFKYKFIFIFVALFQFFIVNAAFTNRGQRLLIQQDSYRKAFYHIYLNEVDLGLMREGEILKVLKGIDFINLENLTQIHISDIRKGVFPHFNFEKAHLDIIGIIPAIASASLIFMDIPDSFMAIEDLPGTCQLIQIGYLLGKGAFVFLALIEEDTPKAESIALMSGLHPFLGMAAEYWLRKHNFRIMLNNKKNIEISADRFYHYLSTIKKYRIKTQ